MRWWRPTKLCVIGLSLVQAGSVSVDGGSDGGLRPVNLVRDVPACRAKVTVDSSFAGYRTDVLADGRWIRHGDEAVVDRAHPSRLGNGGNTWASADEPLDHWIQLAWPRAITLDRVEVCWSRPEWRPRAFRIERQVNGRWQPIDSDTPAWTPTERQTVVAVHTVEVQSVRIVQPAGCGADRDLMAVQEVAVYHQGAGPAASRGVRPLTLTEYRQIVPGDLAPNLARLYEQQPGASRTVAYVRDGSAVGVDTLADGDTTKPAHIPSDAVALGVEWPIRHMADQVTLTFTPELAVPDAMILEAHDGQRWSRVRIGLTRKVSNGKRTCVWTFEPQATRRIRVRFARGRAESGPAELEVRRYMPTRKDVWPDRLVRPGGVQREVLAGEADPSFEMLSMWALSMRPARAFIGLKDGPDEIGVAWDGTLLGRETIRFRFGDHLNRLADFRETLQRTLLDGWRPGVVVQGRIHNVKVRQTVFSVPATDESTGRAITIVRIRVQNLTASPVRFPIRAEVTGSRPGTVAVEDGVLCRGDDAVLLALEQELDSHADTGNALEVPVAAPANGEATLDYVHPQFICRTDAERSLCRSRKFDEALERFRAYWDRILAKAVPLELPEPRVERMYRAVLAQLFINADGDVMPYGARPSVYDGNLYGIEESYAMLALASWGFSDDAQRYLDATYLTRKFLRKVDQYQTYPDRHQQYRNGLQPHYAVRAYRLSGNRDWIRKHVPLLKECADWTMAQRRTTMKLQEGRKPLQWGLLPKWSYGGDIHNVQCYALFANLCCWRGLVDTAWLLDDLGDHATARRYAGEATAYRADIDRAIEGAYQPQARPPFLPLRLYAKQPDEQMDYYQLFAGCILDIDSFSPKSRHYRWITDFLEADNRTFCFLPRFRRDTGEGGLDALYGKGYVLSKLREGAIREFLLGFYAFLAFNMEHDTFVSRETNVIYASDLHVRSKYRVPDMSDPIPCSSAVALHFLRHMLATEELTASGTDSGDLLLLSATPRSWLADGRTIRFEQLPTHFGPISLTVQSAAADGRIEAQVTPPNRTLPRAIKLRLRHPDSRPIRSVTVNGEPWDRFDRDKEWVMLPRTGRPSHVVVSY